MFLLLCCFFTASNDSSSWPVLICVTVEKPDKGDEWEKNWWGEGGGGLMTWKDTGCGLLKMCDVERDGWC